MENRRLKEVKLAVQLNHIDKARYKETYKNLLKILSSFALSFNGETNRMFANAVEGSIADGFLGASNKELIACCKKYYSVRTFNKKLGTSLTTFYKRFNDLLNRDFINEEFLNELKPVLDTKEEMIMVDYMTSFIDNFKLPEDITIPRKLNTERTLEIDFYIIYSKLFSMFRNDNFIAKFIYNICESFNLDYPTIINLKNNIHIINRSFPNFRYNTMYFKQEIVTLFTERGYKKGTIGKKVFEKQSNYLYNNGAKTFAKVINDEDLSWQYAPTIDWKDMDTESVKRFIDILHEFSDYDI
jgi:hypothetical protein